MERTLDVPDDQPRYGAGLLFGLALLYLLAQVFSSAFALGASDEITIMVTTVAQALPAVVGANLIAGAAAALWVPTRSFFARFQGTRKRMALGAIAGAVIGLVVGGGILLTFGVSGGVGALAGTLFAAAVLGGLTGALPPKVLAAALAAT